MMLLPCLFERKKRTRKKRLDKLMTELTRVSGTHTNLNILKHEPASVGPGGVCMHTYGFLTGLAPPIRSHITELFELTRLWQAPSYPSVPFMA